MNRSVLVMNHGALALASRGVDLELRSTPGDAYSDSSHISSFSLSPSTSKSSGVIPGMQEIFTRLSSPPHPSPILAATLGGYTNHVDNYMNEIATTHPTSSCVTTPQSLYSDPINSAEGQSTFENSFEASSSSAIDLVDFPSSLMPNALDEFESVDCGSHSDETHQAVQGMQSKECALDLDDEDMDIVPNELVQFVSESSRRIQGAVAGRLSNRNSNIDEIDHDAQIASLCLPILQPPCLVSSHVSDSLRPPSLSPQTTVDVPLVSEDSNEFTAIEFTRAYLSEPADSHCALAETKEFEEYETDTSNADLKCDLHSEISPQNDPSAHTSNNLSPSFSSTTTEKMSFRQTTYKELILKSSSAVGERYLGSQTSGQSSNHVKHHHMSSVGARHIETTLESIQSMQCFQSPTQNVKICPGLQSLTTNNEQHPGSCFVPCSSSSNSFDQCVNLAATSLNSSIVTPTIPVFQNEATSTHMDGVCTVECETIPGTLKVSPTHENYPQLNLSTNTSSGLLGTTVSDGRWNGAPTSNVAFAPNCVTPIDKLNEPANSRVATHLVSTPVLCQSEPLTNSAQTSITGSGLHPGSVHLITQSTLSPPVPESYPPTTPTISLLLNTDTNKSNSFTTNSTNQNVLNTLNLPLQILQALPNLRPGMSIVFNVKNDRSAAPVRTTSSKVPGASASSIFVNNTVTPRTDGTVFVLPGSHVAMSGPTQLQTPQLIPTQRSCHLNSTLSPSVLFIPSVPSSTTNSVILSNGLNSVTDMTTNGSSSVVGSSLPSATQFLLLRSPPKPDLKLTGSTQASGITSLSSEMAFLISTNSASKTQTKSPGVLFLPTAVPSSINQPTCLIPNPSNLLNFQSFNPTSSNVSDSSALSLGCRPSDLQSLLGYASNSGCLQLGVGQTTATLHNTLFAAALNRSISSGLTASTLSFPISVFPTNQQTLFMSPSTSVLQPSSTFHNLLSSSLPSPPTSITHQTTTGISTSSSFSSVSLDPNLKLSPTAPPGLFSTTLPCTSAQSALSTLGTMITYVPSTTTTIATTTTTTATTTVDSSLNSPILEPKKLIVLPSAENLLSSSSRASLLSSSVPSISIAYQQTCSYPGSNFSGLSCAQQPSSPSVLTPVCKTVTSKSATLVTPQLGTTIHGNSRRRHQCPYCPKSCERKDNLQAHIRTHTGERPYPCRFCPKAFPQKDHLRAHIRTHTGEKPYRCPQCMKAFAQLGNLHRHVKTHKR